MASINAHFSNISQIKANKGESFGKQSGNILYHSPAKSSSIKFWVLAALMLAISFAYDIAAHILCIYLYA